MQSTLERYISLIGKAETITPVILSHEDTLVVLNRISNNDFGSLEKAQKEYIDNVYFYSIPEDKSEFPIETVKEFIIQSSKSPYTGNAIYILLDIDKGSLKAMNALLKVLEDTPKHSVIILTVTEAESMLETIHSRTINLFRKSHNYVISTEYDSIVRDFFAGKKEDLLLLLYGKKIDQPGAIAILETAIKYAPREDLERIEQGLFHLFTSNEIPRNILDLVFVSTFPKI